MNLGEITPILFRIEQLWLYCKCFHCKACKLFIVSRLCLSTLHIQEYVCTCFPGIRIVKVPYLGRFSCSSNNQNWSSTMFCASKDSTACVESTGNHIRTIWKSFCCGIVDDCACTRNPCTSTRTSQYNPVIINFCRAMTTTFIRKIRSLSNAAVGMYEFCSMSAPGLW